MIAPAPNPQLSPAAIAMVRKRALNQTRKDIVLVSAALNWFITEQGDFELRDISKQFASPPEQAQVLDSIVELYMEAHNLFDEYLAIARESFPGDFS